MSKDSNKNGAKCNESDKSLSLIDFVDPTNPWDLRDRLPEDLRNMFTFLPKKFTEGPWNPVVTIFMLFALLAVCHLTIDANTKHYASSENKEIMEQFIGDKQYPAFTLSWSYNFTLFCWMTYVCWAIYKRYSSFGAWVTFTIWSWTIMCIRHGLCALAPFFPSARLLIGTLRFPVLLSASVTFIIWNFVLMPVIGMGLLKGERRSNFLRFAFKWTMCQIHLANIIYAYLNCIWAEPTTQRLHLGDVNAAVLYVVTYVLFYYFFLDRIGVQLVRVFVR